jgi:hypothetical protein
LIVLKLCHDVPGVPNQFGTARTGMRSFFVQYKACPTQSHRVSLGLTGRAIPVFLIMDALRFPMVGGLRTTVGHEFTLFRVFQKPTPPLTMSERGAPM